MSFLARLVAIRWGGLLLLVGARGEPVTRSYVGLGPLPSAETQKKKIAWKDFWTEMPDFDCRDVTDFPYVDFINAHQGICGNDFQAAYRAATEEEQMMIEANAGQAEEEVQGKKGQKSKLWMTLLIKKAEKMQLFDSKYLLRLNKQCRFALIVQEVLQHVMCLFKPTDTRCMNNLIVPDHWVPIIFHYSLPVVLNSVAQAAMGCYFLIAKEFRYGYFGFLEEEIEKAILMRFKSNSWVTPEDAYFRVDYETVVNGLENEVEKNIFAPNREETSPPVEATTASSVAEIKESLQKNDDARSFTASALMDMSSKMQEALNCKDTEEFAWEKFRLSIDDQPTNFIMSSFKYAWGAGVLQRAKKDDQFFKSCPFGALTIILIRLVVAQRGMYSLYLYVYAVRQEQKRSEDYGTLVYPDFLNRLLSLHDNFQDLLLRKWETPTAVLLGGNIIPDLLTALTLTDWPVLALLQICATGVGGVGYQYKPYMLDFLRNEMLLHYTQGRTTSDHEERHRYEIAMAEEEGASREQSYKLDLRIYSTDHSPFIFDVRKLITENLLQPRRKTFDLPFAGASQDPNSKTEDLRPVLGTDLDKVLRENEVVTLSDVFRQCEISVVVFAKGTEEEEMEVFVDLERLRAKYQEDARIAQQAVPQSSIVCESNLTCLVHSSSTWVAPYALPNLEFHARRVLTVEYDPKNATDLSFTETIAGWKNATAVTFGTGGVPAVTLRESPDVSILTTAEQAMLEVCVSDGVMGAGRIAELTETSNSYESVEKMFVEPLAGMYKGENVLASTAVKPNIKNNTFTLNLDEGNPDMVIGTKHFFNLTNTEHMTLLIRVIKNLRHNLRHRLYTNSFGKILNALMDALAVHIQIEQHGGYENQLHIKSGVTTGVFENEKLGSMFADLEVASRERQDAEAVEDESQSPLVNGFNYNAKPRFYITMIWGTRYLDYLGPFLRRADAFGMAKSFFIFCLDEVSCAKCEEVHPHAPRNRNNGIIYPDIDVTFQTENPMDANLCIEGQQKSIFNKYTATSIISRLGFDVVYFDLDTVLLQDPTPFFNEIRDDRKIDMATCRDFRVKCTNTGIIYFKSTPSTQMFLNNWLTWIWWHPYEFSQKAFASFFGIEEVSRYMDEAPPGPGFYPETGVRRPHLRYFNSTQQFVTQKIYGDAEGWHGRVEDIVVFHFVDGTGKVDEERAVKKRYVNAYDVFYRNPKIDLTNTRVPLHVQDPDIESFLLDSRWDEPVDESNLQACTLLGESHDPETA